MRNAIAHVAKGQRDMVAAVIRTAFVQENYEAAVCRKYMTLETLAQISHPDQGPIQIAAE